MDKKKVKTRYIKAKQEKRQANRQKNTRSRSNPKLPLTENEYLLDNADIIYDEHYRLDRHDNGTGGGKQAGKYNLDSADKLNWKDYQGDV